jgi:hypothetical protein
MARIARESYLPMAMRLAEEHAPNIPGHAGWVFCMRLSESIPQRSLDPNNLRKLEQKAHYRPINLSASYV